MSDEREGALSASAVEAAALCPGKPAAEAGKPDDVGPLAEAGTRMHKAFEEGNVHGLQPDERELVLKADGMYRELEESWLGRLNPDLFPEDVAEHHYREERVWGFDRRLSGKYDGLRIKGDAGLLYDLKTGYAEAQEATRNFQLRTLAVLAARQYGLKQITVALIQPNLFPPRVSECVYNEAEIDQSEKELAAIIDRSLNPAARRIPGPVQCKWCKAKTTCPEARKATTELAKVDTAALTPAQLPGLLDACTMAEQIIKAIRQQAREELNACADAVPGWKLKAGAKMEKIIDPELLFQRLHHHYEVPAEAFVGVCSVSKTKLRSLLKESSNLKGKALGEAETMLLDGLTETKRKAASLCKEVKP